MLGHPHILAARGAAGNPRVSAAPDDGLVIVPAGLGQGAVSP